MNPLFAFSLHHNNLEAGLTLVLELCSEVWGGGEMGIWNDNGAGCSENYIREDFIF